MQREVSPSFTMCMGFKWYGNGEKKDIEFSHASSWGFLDI
jgi:hypothetical protein